MSAHDGDLRNSSKDQFFKDLHASMGVGGLLTYRYLRRKCSDMHKTDYDGLVIRHDMRNRCGGINAAPLAIGAAEAGGWTDFNAVPAPIMYSLSFLDDGRGVAEIRVVRNAIKMGRTIGFTASSIVDAADPTRVIAVTRGIGIKLGDAPETGEGADVPLDDGADLNIVDSPSLPPLYEVFGGYRTAEENWALPILNPAIRSTSGNLHLGPIHIICEAAAEHLVRTLTGTDQCQIEQWDVMFIAPGLVGPFVVRGDAVSGNLGRAIARLTLHDEGKSARIVATATAVYRQAY